MNRKRKNLDLKPSTIKTLAIEAIKHDLVFKTLAENILETAAQKIESKTIVKK